MNEPAPTGINPSNMVDQHQKDAEKNIANNLNVKPEDVSAQHRFPLKPLEELGGEIVDEVHDFTEYAKATAEGPNYARTTDSKNILSILKNRLIGKKAA